MQNEIFRPKAPSVDDALDAQFRELTEAGNLAFERHDHATASRLCNEALTEAERLFELAMTAGGSPVLLAPMVHNIACQNAAQARKRAGDGVGALALQVRALKRLVTTAESAASPITLRVNCVRHLKYALAFLAEDLTEREPDMDAIRALVARARLVAAEVMRIAGLVLAGEVAFGAAPSHSNAGASRRVLS